MPNATLANIGKGLSSASDAASQKPKTASDNSTSYTPAQSDAAKPGLISKLGGELKKLHKGGTVDADGPYLMKKGEHVLTAREAGKAKKAALLLKGLKSLQNSGTKQKSKA